MHRMYVVSRLVAPPRLVAPSICRFMASKATPPPPQKLDTNQGPKPTPTPSSSTKQASTQTPPNKPATKQASTQTGNKSQMSKTDYDSARLALPVRFYNKSGRLASRLFILSEHSKNKDDLKKVYTALSSLGALMKKDKRAESYFINPTRSADEKRKLMQVLAKKVEMPPVLMQFFEELWKKDIKVLSKMIADFDTLYMARNKTVNVSVTLAEQNQPKPTEAQVREALSFDKDTTVRLNFTVDPAIEGGAILRSKNKIADFSHAKIIKQYKEKLASLDSKGANAEKFRVLSEIKKMKDSIDI